MFLRAILRTALFLLAACAALRAEVPELINYQGLLNDPMGNPVSGNRTMVVRVYDAPSGGNMTYEETIGTVEVANGTFSFEFGSAGGGIAAVLDGSGEYLALSVNGTEEDTRTRLLAVPFALKAQSVVSVTGGNSVSSNATGISFTGDAAANTRTNLGLGNSSTRNVGTGESDVASGNHTHDAADITAGIFDNDRVNWAAPGAIGSTTPAAGNFTTLSANNGILSTSAPVLNLGQTWNSSGTTFNGVRLNITETAAAAGSRYLNLQQGGTDVLSLQSQIGNGVNEVIRISGPSRGFVFGPHGTGLSSAFFSLRWQTNVAGLARDAIFAWGSSVYDLNYDLAIQRDAADTLAQRRTTNPQTFNIYNTFGNATNHERGFLRWNANVFEVGTEEGSSGGTRRDMRLKTGIGTNIDIMQGGGTLAWRFASTGELIPNATNTRDIGTTSTRVRTGYFENLFAGTGIELYNARTSATNFERLNIRKASNEFIIDAQAGADGGTLRGIKIGNATSSLLGFYGAAPVDQPSLDADLLDSLQDLGLIASGSGDTPLDLSGGSLKAGNLSLTDNTGGETATFDVQTRLSANRTYILPDSDGTLALTSDIPAGYADGDVGDITVSGNGTTWSIDAGAVGTAQLGGDITAAGEALLDDADAAAQRTTLGLGNSSTLDTGTTAGTVAAGDHTHAAADVTSGIFDNDRINWAAPGAIGSTTPAAGNFTTLTASAIEIPDGSRTSLPFYFKEDTNTGLYRRGNDTITFVASGSNRFEVSGNQVRLEVNSTLNWVFNDLSGSPDLTLLRDTAHTLAQRGGTNAQESRLYGTYSNASSYQRMTTRSVKQTLSALSGSSVSTAGTLIPDGAVVVGVTTRVATALSGATGYQVGDGTDADRWGDITGTAVGTTSDNTNWTAGSIECFIAGGEVTLTANGSDFTGGAVEVCVFYLAGQAD